MKLAVTSDLHVPHFTDPEVVIGQFIQSLLDHDALAIAGDFGRGWIDGALDIYDSILSMHPTTLFVLGNHDLWRKGFERLPPPEAFEDAMRLFRSGTPLEKSWGDPKTIARIGDTVFVGSIGFPDFKMPTLMLPQEYYNKRENCPTKDVKFMDMSLGWLVYTEPLVRGFGARLKLAFKSAAKNVIVVTHYSIFESQRQIKTIRDVEFNAYFGNHGMGQMVLKQAKAHPDKKVWCVCGHSHAYCSGRFVKEAENVVSYGIQNDYTFLRHVSIDTNDFPQ